MTVDVALLNPYEDAIVVIIALRNDRVGDDGCRLQIGDRITTKHAMLHPEAVTTEHRP